MTRSLRIAVTWLLALACHAADARAEEGRRAAFPLRASDDGRYLVDSAGQPFFMHADTAWQAAKRLSTADFQRYLADRAERGFNTVFLHAISREVTPDANQAGHRPFDPPNDLGSPHEPYWRQLDETLRTAEEQGFFVAIAPLWIRWGGGDVAGWRTHFPEALADQYGEFLGRRFAERKNILWILGGDANPQEKSRAIDLLGKALKRTAPHHLLTVHNRPDNSSAAFFDAADWLDVNMAYTYRETYLHVGGEWNRLGQRRPIILGESGYEEESNDGRGGAPHRVRRQAYGAVLSGALGGHAFGNAHIWRMDEHYREALDSPASRQMRFVVELFSQLPWNQLVPEDRFPPPPPEFAEIAARERDQLIVGGRGLFGEVDYVTAARTPDGHLAVIYLPVGRTIELNLDYMSRPLAAFWYDPTDGARHEIDAAAIQQGECHLTPPARNAAGDNDWVLLLRRRLD